MLKLAASKIATRIDHYYQRALQRIGATDTTEMRVAAAVHVVILLWYLCVAVQYAINLITAAAATVTVSVTQ